MATLKGDLHRQLALVRGTNPVATGSTAQTGSTYDKAASSTAGKPDGANAVAVVFYFGTYTDGTWTPSLEESDDNSAWTAVAAADQVGTLTAVDSATAEDNVIQAVSYIGAKRYVRGILAETVNGTTGILYACLYIGAGGEYNTSVEAG